MPTAMETLDWEKVLYVLDDDGFPNYPNCLYYVTAEGDVEGGYLVMPDGKVYERIVLHKENYNRIDPMDGRLVVWERADGIYVRFVWREYQWGGEELIPAEDPVR